MIRRAIVWFRQDLRLDDNEALTEALHTVDEVYPVYVFDPRKINAQTTFGFHKTGDHRLRFLHESVSDLRKQLRELGCDLVVRMGHPEEELARLAKKLHTKWVFCNRERTRDEVLVQDSLEQNLWSIGQEIRYTRGKMLYYTRDLPFPVTHTPDTFSSFRKEVVDITPVRAPLPRPESLNTITEVDPGELQSLDELACRSIAVTNANSLFAGGEKTAHLRLEDLLRDDLTSYTDEHKLLDHSSLISPWISSGCISPKRVYANLQTKISQDRNCRASAEIIKQGLLRRDFLRLMGKKHTNKIFLRGGIRAEENRKLKNDDKALKKWMEGRTAKPLINAFMQELSTTGYLSTKGRQISATYLVHEMGVNWQMGASYFESVLIDYDPCSNYGNWNRVADVDLDDRKLKHYNLAAQVRKYDPEAEYIRKWTSAYQGQSPREIHAMHEHQSHC